MAAKTQAAGLCLCIVLLTAGACGYRFSGDGKHLNPSLRSVYVETLENRTTEANIENIFRSAFVEWFIKGNRFRVVEEPAKADAIWQGAIVKLVTSPISYRSADFAQEERITVTLHLKFYERESGKVIWEDGDFTDNREYPVPNVQDTEILKRDALSKLADHMAERAYRMMMSGF